VGPDLTTSTQAPLRTDRADLLARLAEPGDYDVAVIGGGATGLGVALDAVTRGLRVVLVEAHDFAKGTSSRATKLVHGGVRYLEQRNFPLVREALRERQILLRNAPHLAQPLAFVVPAYRFWERPYYGTGLVLYDVLAGKAGLGRTRWLDSRAITARQPGLRTQGLRGGIEYWDGQFDDARLAIALARTAARAGALLVNHCAAVGLIREQGRVAGVRCEDRETGRSYALRAACVVNAAGIWVDAVRRLDTRVEAAEDTILFSQGAHVVVSRDFLPGDRALLVPARATAGCCSRCPGWAGPSSAPPTRPGPARNWSRDRWPRKWTSCWARPAATWHARRAPATSPAPGRACVRWCARRGTPAPRTSAASTWCGSRTTDWSPWPAASGPRIGPWPRTRWMPAWTPAC